MRKVQFAHEGWSLISRVHSAVLEYVEVSIVDHQAHGEA
jgi:hypothetical protein